MGVSVRITRKIDKAVVYLDASALDRIGILHIGGRAHILLCPVKRLTLDPDALAVLRDLEINEL